MWFDYKKHAAPIYNDETYRRLFATASGRNRPKGVDKLKKMKGPGEAKGWRRWFALGRKRSDTDH